MKIYTPAELRAEAHEIAQWGPEWQGQAAMLRQAAEDRARIEKALAFLEQSAVTRIRTVLNQQYDEYIAAVLREGQGDSRP